MIRELMTQEAMLALQAHKGGNVPLYEVHRANARRLADHLTLQEQQERELARRPTVYLAPGVVTGPDESDFLKKDNAITALVRIALPYLAAIGAACLIAARALGWI